MSRTGFTGRAAVFAIVVVIVVATVALPMRAWFAQRAQIDKLTSQVNEAQAAVAQLQTQQERWRDPAYVAAQARSRLHFVKPGEVGYIVLGEDSSPDVTSPSAPASAGPSTWYSHVLDSLRAVDSR